MRDKKKRFKLHKLIFIFEQLDTLKSFDNRVHNLLASINQVQKQTDVWKRLHTSN